MDSGSTESTLSPTITRSTSLSHKHRQSPPPPIPTRRSSRFNFNLSGALPTPDLVGSIATGAHYVGASPTHHDGFSAVGRHRRSSSRTMSEDPAVVEHAYKEAMDDLTEMYCGRPTMEILHRRWRRDAEFEDPWCLCKGFEQYAPQWFALPRIYTHCEQESIRILSANLAPNRLVYAQTMICTVRWFNFKKVIDSIIVVDFDEDFKVIRLVDQWNGEHLPTRWGSLYLRKFSAKLIPWLVRVPKDKTS